LTAQSFDPSTNGLGEISGTRAAKLAGSGLIPRNLADGNEFDVEDEGGVGRDVGTGAAGSVAELRRNVETILGAGGHELEAFGPAGDDAVEREGNRFFALIARVENGAVGEAAFVVDFYSA